MGLSMVHVSCKRDDCYVSRTWEASGMELQLLRIMRSGDFRSLVLEPLYFPLDRNPYRTVFTPG